MKYTPLLTTNLRKKTPIMLEERKNTVEVKKMMRKEMMT
jgi:hypothetical protein